MFKHGIKAVDAAGYTCATPPLLLLQHEAFQVAGQCLLEF